jgi:hypothetical protein
MVYVTISSTKSFSELKNAISMSFNAGSASGSGGMSTDAQTTLNEATMTVSAIGIEDAAASALIKTGQIQQFFGAIEDIRSAKPISYIFYNLRDLSIAGITDSATYDLTVCQPQAVDQQTTTQSTAVDTNLQNYYQFVISAAGNVNDPPTQRLRIGQYRGFHAEIIANLAMGSPGSFSSGVVGGSLVLPASLSPDDRTWLRGWVPVVINEIQRQLRVWHNAYQNNTWKHKAYTRMQFISQAIS